VKVSPLARYLHDHLAGAEYALDLIDEFKKQHRGQELGAFAERLYIEIAADKDTLHNLVSNFGAASDPLKDGAAWIAAKVSQLKLKHNDPSSLGSLEALEILAQGIHGKAGLWRALASVTHHHNGFGGTNFPELLRRAHEQERAVEEHRIAAAQQVLVVPT
jgi:hypothetical protein